MEDEKRRAAHAAVTAIAPSKSEAFLAVTDAEFQGPIPGELRFGPQGRFAPMQASTRSLPSSVAGVPLSGSRTANEDLGRFLNMTPYEIYLDFRTAPIGSLGVTGALWQTSVVLSAGAYLGWQAGTYIGTNIVAPLIQTYAPDLWDTIGGTINSIVDELTQSWSGGTATAAAAQSSTAQTFQSSPAQLTDFPLYGGDYGCAEDWRIESGNGGSTCRPGYHCAPIAEH